MLKENKWKIILSSIMILLPILFGLIMWDALPDIMTTHWGADGNQDGYSEKVFVVFGLPVILLMGHFICLYFTFRDKKQKNQNKKALGIIFWIIPIISLFTSGIIYAVAFGKELSFGLIVPGMLGILFVFIGNYLPKIKQNRTLGIKIAWTLNNEDNWNKTHRLGGKVWVIGGFIMLFSVFLSPVAMVSVFVCVMIVMIIIPIVYSYSIYKKHKKEGIKYDVPPKSKSEKIASIITVIIVSAIMIGTAILMFTGNIEVRCGETDLRINADYWRDVKVQYSEIDTVSYREDLNIGIRSNGFGSARLSMGIFQNDEFGYYTLYAYTGAEEFMVISSGDKILVIGMKDPHETQKIYDAVLQKSGK